MADEPNPPRVQHECFIAPDDPDASLWRYMDLWKLASMLSTGGLWMCRLDLFRSEDPFEGTVPKSYVDEAAQREEAVKDQLRRAGHSVPHQSPPSEFVEVPGVFEMFASGLYTNCWNLGGHESNALWRIYCGQSGGIALRSTFNRLRNGVSANCHVGMVRYIDHAAEHLQRENGFEPALLKRRVFDYEREVRIVKMRSENLFEPQPPTGVVEVVDLNALICEVRTSPYSPPGYREAVQAVVERFGYAFKVSSSEMLTPPSRDVMLVPAPQHFDAEPREQPPQTTTP